MKNSFPCVSRGKGAMKLESQAIDDLHQLALLLFKRDKKSIRELNALYSAHVAFLAERIRHAPGHGVGK
jgi:hypothetical protein